MKYLKFFCPRIAVDIKRRLVSLKKEVFRKSIHLCTAFIPLLMCFFKWPVTVLLILALVLYTVSEIFRQRGVEIPVVGIITSTAARSRDRNKFVLGPVTLVLGILAASFLWSSKAAAVGIFALAFGDGLASLAGKTMGKIEIPFTGGKTVAGSITCFNAIFCSSWLVVQNTNVALIVALAGALIEVLPLKDFDNLLIPVVLGGIVEFLLPHIQFVQCL